MNKIPIVEDSQFKGMKLGEIRNFVKAHYESKFKGKNVINEDKGITVTLGREGLHHTIYARNAGYIKLKALLIINEMIESAVYCNFKDADSDDPKDIIGYMNFKSKVIIEGLNHVFRISVRLSKEGKFFYDHAVRVKK